LVITSQVHLSEWFVKFFFFVFAAMFACMKLSYLISAVSVALLSVRVSASAFLHSRAQGALQQVTRELIEGTLRSELIKDAAHFEKLQGYENELRAMFNALPKNEHGN